MDVFDEELIKFWRSLHKASVKYIMIGGVAVNLHGYHRTTADIDVWIEDSANNRVALRKAFKLYGSGDFEEIQRIQFVAGWTYFHLNNGIRLDIMTVLKGVEGYSFDECFNMCAIAEIYDLQIPFLHINQLISTKKAANRTKDQLDIIALERIKKLLEEDPGLQKP